ETQRAMRGEGRVRPGRLTEEGTVEPTHGDLSVVGDVVNTWLNRLEEKARTRTSLTEMEKDGLLGIMSYATPSGQRQILRAVDEILQSVQESRPDLFNEYVALRNELERAAEEAGGFPIDYEERLGRALAQGEITPEEYDERTTIYRCLE